MQLISFQSELSMHAAGMHAAQVGSRSDARDGSFRLQDTVDANDELDAIFLMKRVEQQLGLKCKDGLRLLSQNTLY